MPGYRKKITRQMDYQEFEEAIQDLRPDQQAFLSILFFSGCRISEALALRASNIACRPDTVYIDFFRLKGSKPTDPIPIPRTKYVNWLCSQYNEVFTFCRKTGYNIVRKAFAELYPHYFRMNRITKISEDFGDAYVYSFVGICAQSIDNYRGKVNIRKVGQALSEELKY